MSVPTCVFLCLAPVHDGRSTAPMSQQRRGQVSVGEPGFAPEHLFDLVKAVRPHEERSSLTPRERIMASRALKSLAALAGDNVGAPAVAAFTYVELPAWLALLQVNSIATRTVAEAGGAARAAANSRHAERSASSASSSEVPKASSGDAWAEAVQYSSGLLGTLLGKQLENPPPDPNQHPSDSLEQLTASMEAHIRRRGYRLASALLRSGALSALSRLLAAEQHRGTAAVLDVDTVITTLWPLVRLLRLASLWPKETLWLGQEVGKAQLGPAVLRALAASSVVEHVCKFAVMRLAGRQAGGGTAGLGTKQLNQHSAFVMTLLQWMTSYATQALKEGGEVAADARAVLSCPCYQYLVHLHAVSQLHALDGGTTYGLPYDKLLPPVRADGAEAGSGGPTVLGYTGLQTAFFLWRRAEAGEGTSLHTLSGRRMVLDLLLRIARAVLDSGDYVAATNRGSSSGSSSSSGAGGQGSGRGAGAAGSSQGQPSAAPGPGHGPAAVLKVDREYPSHCLAELAGTLVICTGCAEPDGNGSSSDRSSSSDSGSGSHGTGGTSAAVSGSGAGAGSSSGGSGACLGGKQVEQDGDSTGPSWLWWWRRDHGRWWRLAVRAVHAEMDRGDDRIDPTHAMEQIVSAMHWLWFAGEKLDTGASRPAASIPRAARSWLSAAVSAGYLPCLERLTRTMASPECCYPAPLVERAPLVLWLLHGRGLAVLALHGEERQAAALMVTAVKATAGLAGGDVCRETALQQFADIPGALVARAFETVGVQEEDGEQRQEPALQREQQAKLLRLLSLCIARWLPRYAALLPGAWNAAGPGRKDKAGPGAHALLLRSGRRMVRLAGLARGAAEGRGDARAAESWGRLLATCGGIAAAKGGQGQADGVAGKQEEASGEQDGRDLTALAALLPPPCDVAVLPACRNPLCCNLERDSEAGLQLVACGGRCGDNGCSGEGPCCCRMCLDVKRAWHRLAT